MTRYASQTSVPVARTRAEIESLLTKSGALRIGVMTEPRLAVVGFSIQQWHVRFRMPLPSVEDKLYAFKDFNAAHPYERRSKEATQSLWEQDCRSYWRALLLAIKAKLVSVETKVETFEEAFMAHLVMPGGQTVGEQALPAVVEAYRTGKPTLLLGAGRSP